jgi:hypothetical protein
MWLRDTGAAASWHRRCKDTACWVGSVRLRQRVTCAVQQHAR